MKLWLWLWLPIALGTGLAVFFGVWAFNFGHLGFVLRCAGQLDKLGDVLDAALDDDNKKYQSALRDTFRDMREVGFLWPLSNSTLSDQILASDHVGKYNVMC